MALVHFKLTKQAMGLPPFPQSKMCPVGKSIFPFLVFPTASSREGNNINFKMRPETTLLIVDGHEKSQGSEIPTHVTICLGPQLSLKALVFVVAKSRFKLDASVNDLCLSLQTASTLAVKCEFKVGVNTRLINTDISIFLNY